MGAESVGVGQPKAKRLADDEAELSLGRWDVATAAHVLSRLLPAPVAAAEVRRRAIALGLLHEPSPGAPTELTAKALSRLFLAGYHLPAQAEHGSLQRLQHHLRERRQVFVSWRMPELESGPESAAAELIYQVCDQQHVANQEPVVLLSQPDMPEGTIRPLALHEFLAGWEATGYRLVVAVGSWEELPRDGKRFFAGSRGRDGTLHWATAEYDTDAAGRILRA